MSALRNTLTEAPGAKHGFGACKYPCMPNYLQRDKRRHGLAGLLTCPAPVRHGGMPSGFLWCSAVLRLLAPTSWLGVLMFSPSEQLS